VKFPTIKVNIVSLIKFVKKFLKWRRQQIINGGKRCVGKGKKKNP